MAKYLTLIILSLAFIVGSIGAFIPTFNMDGYGDFLGAYAPIFITLLLSIGGNSALQKYKGGKDAK